MSPAKLRVALVGCGQIADAHLQEIRRVEGAETVAVCDRHRDLAGQASARFGVPGVFDDLGRMLAEAGPDVLHVTTPPHTHLPIALQAIGAGVHVYLEKPFAIDAAEADEILGAAKRAGRLVCVGHDQLFDPTWLECRRLVDAGRLGRVVHVESIQGYDLTGPFGRAFIEDRDHWVRRLPGGLFQNVMSHALYRITDLLPEESLRAVASWSGEGAAGGLPTELRVMLSGSEATAGLVFSSAARPVQRVARVFGTRGGIEVDLDAGVVRGFTKAKLPGAFARVEAPIRQGGEAARLTMRSVGRFLRSDLHYFGGMRALFQSFYRAISGGGESPIPPAEIRRVTALMDAIFASCRGRGEEGDPGAVEVAGPGPSAGLPVGVRP